MKRTDRSFEDEDPRSRSRPWPWQELRSDFASILSNKNSTITRPRNFAVDIKTQKAEGITPLCFRSKYLTRTDLHTKHRVSLFFADSLVDLKRELHRRKREIKRNSLILVLVRSLSTIWRLEENICQLVGIKILYREKYHEI